MLLDEPAEQEGRWRMITEKYFRIWGVRDGGRRVVEPCLRDVEAAACVDCMEHIAHRTGEHGEAEELRLAAFLGNFSC